MGFASDTDQKNLANRHRKSRLFAMLCAAITWLDSRHDNKI